MLRPGMPRPQGGYNLSKKNIASNFTNQLDNKKIQMPAKKWLTPGTTQPGISQSSQHQPRHQTSQPRNQTTIPMHAAWGYGLYQTHRIKLGHPLESIPSNQIASPQIKSSYLLGSNWTTTAKKGQPSSWCRIGHALKGKKNNRRQSEQQDNKTGLWIWRSYRKLKSIAKQTAN